MVASVGVVTNRAIVVTHLDEMIAGVGVVTNRDTLVTLLEEAELCLGRNYFDKYVRSWQGFGLGRSQDVELSHGGL